MVRCARIIGILAGAALTGCGTLPTGETAADQQFRDTRVEELSDGRIAITIEAINVDGYELTRCVAVVYADSLRNEDGDRLHSHVKLIGGKLTDVFRRAGGIRTQTSSGTLVYEMADNGSHDGRDVLGIDEQLAECESTDVATQEG